MNRRETSDRTGPDAPRRAAAAAAAAPAAAPAGSAAPFPSEQEWLRLAPPAELAADLPPDFVARTVAALAAERQSQVLPRHQLEAFAPPTPATDFVAQTLQRVQQDRRERWRSLLAKHVAPEPGPQFVARTLRALAHERASAVSAWPRRLSPHAAIWMAAAAAALLLYFGLPPANPPAPHTDPTVAVAPLGTERAEPPRQAPAATTDLPERRLPMFAHAQSASPLPGLLVALEADLDPEALTSAAANGRWLAEVRR